MAKKTRSKGATAQIIGVSGAPGSFSEEAARIYAHGKGIHRPTIQYLITVEAVSRMTIDFLFRPDI
jgi:hypothetical protein